jgi:WD40 repeat protein/serine/threonine protein kinase
MAAEELRITVLGPPSIALGSQPVTGFVSSKAQALVFYLAVTGQSHTRETLAGLLWSDMPEKAARRNLRNAFSNLRRLIGPNLHITRQTAGLNQQAPVAVDSEHFAAKLAGIQRNGPDLEDLTHLEEAVDLYRGEFLAGFYVSDAPLFEEWVLVERERLRGEMTGTLERLVQGNSTRGEFKSAIGFAQRWLAMDPLRESAHRALMELYARSGDRSAALRQYESCVQVLEEELSVEPLPETTDLYRRIYDGELRSGPTPPGERAVRGFEIRERLGQGSFGIVYRAYQPQVNRDVALKVILPQYANQPVFIRRFETEAQLVARLEHPNIVPLYDYWREPDNAYLVMRWLRGGSLAAALERGPWNLEAAARLVDHIAAALATAHRQGIVHRDIKPQNILFDEEDNAYLSDFGIAKDLMRPVSPENADAVPSSPAYISPEQAKSEPLTAQSDLYSLGVVMYQVLTGEHPFASVTPANQIAKHLTEPLPPLQERRPDLPLSLDEVIQRATDKERTRRYSEALEFADAFRTAALSQVEDVAVNYKRIDQSLDRTSLELVNPYKGLQAFEEADAANFHGREALTGRLLARLIGEGDPSADTGQAPAGSPGQNLGRFLAVVGPSGSGKSSAVSAGLIPALRNGALPGSENWFIAVMVPGAHPLEELELALLGIAVRQTPNLLAQLQEDERGLLRAVRRILPPLGELVVVIDQLEELFTLVEDPAERAIFLRSLYAAVADTRSPLRVIAVLRADFYDRPLMHQEFSALMDKHTQVVTPLTLNELERTIRAPAEGVDVTLEPGLAAMITSEVGEQQGALPMLQYALTELFERREGGVLTKAAYEETGGVMGALARRAEEIYAGLEADSQEVARQLFLRLITLGEGAEDTRRRVLRAELISIGSDPDKIKVVIDLFGQHRLLTFDRDHATRGPTVEVAHEALLREWGRLRRWLEDSRDDVRQHRKLTSAAAEWQGSGRDPGFLLRSSRLDQLELWSTTTGLALSQVEQELLEASITAREQRLAEEEARRLMELETAQKLAETEMARAEEQSRAAQRLRRRALFLAGALLISVILAVVAFGFGRQATRNADAAQVEAKSRATAEAVAMQESEAAQEQARLATARELAAAAINNLDVDPERSILLALQAVRTTYDEDQTVLPEAETVLHQAVSASHVLYTVMNDTGSEESWITNVAFSPDGTRLVTLGGNDNLAIVRDADTGRELFRLSHSDVFPGAFGLAFSPDGSRLVTSDSGDMTTRVWDAETGEELLTLSGEHSDWLNYVNFSPDGTRLITTSIDGTAKVWDIESGQVIHTLGDHTGFVWDAAFSSDGRHIATADEAASHIWDAASGEKLLTLSGHTAGTSQLAFSPVESKLATASFDGTAKVWDVETGEELLSLTSHTDVVFDVAFSPDGTRLATASNDGTAKVWDLATGKEMMNLAGHTDVVVAIAFSPDGIRLATGGGDGTARVWDIAPDQELLSFISGTVYDMDVSPDETRLATSSAGGTATVWDAATGEELFTVSDAGHEEPLTEVEFGPDATRLEPGVDFSPDGTRLATAGSGNVARIWDATTGQLQLTLSGHTDLVNGIAFSPDGKLLATASHDLTTKVWDAVTGEALLTLPGELASTNYVAFSPDGSSLVSAGLGNMAIIWDTATGEELMTLSGHTASVNYAVFSPDGTRLATASGDGVAKVWDIATGDEILTLTGHSHDVNSIAFSPDGARLATASTDGTTRIWDAESGQELLAISTQPIGVGRVAFSQDGTRLITANWDNTVRVYVLPIEELMNLAQSRLTRSLTTEECQQYLHVETCPPDS